ncbi:hypothetical protein HME9304_03113 [Flagellimonas maritima]|uniref:Uncharacterized protein n=1 Tax=Flagellimonas maritima TaxID=1383885 RepID=A0A2Z4LVZ0_9FLAO|nr:hypothetical protein [Allomuricauda aurantiaca]AWX46081.1 hypothetical protein HME9304_03113 [Allomuricauda aurantiaca]
MDVVKEIIQNSAIGPLSNLSKGLVLSLFSFIVGLLLMMLGLLLKHGSQISIQFGY